MSERRRDRTYRPRYTDIPRDTTIPHPGTLHIFAVTSTADVLFSLCLVRARTYRPLSICRVSLPTPPRSDLPPPHATISRSTGFGSRQPRRKQRSSCSVISGSAGCVHLCLCSVLRSTLHKDYEDITSPPDIRGKTYLPVRESIQWTLVTSLSDTRVLTCLASPSLLVS